MGTEKLKKFYHSSNLARVQILMTVKEYLRQLEGEEVIVEGKELPGVGVDHCVARQPLLLKEPLDHLKVAWEKYDVNLVEQCLVLDSKLKKNLLIAPSCSLRYLVRHQLAHDQVGRDQIDPGLSGPQRRSLGSLELEDVLDVGCGEHSHAGHPVQRPHQAGLQYQLLPSNQPKLMVLNVTSTKVGAKMRQKIDVKWGLGRNYEEGQNKSRLKNFNRTKMK